MATVSDIIKEALHYPKANLKNTAITGIFLLLFMIFFVFGNYFIANDIRNRILADPFTYNYNSVFEFMGYASPTSQAVFVIFVIVAFICYFVAQGYFYRIYQNTVLKIDSEPQYNQPKSILAEGIKIFVVNFTYLIIPAVIVSVGGYYNAAIFAIGIILAVIAYLVLPIAISNMAYTKSFSGAYRFSEIGQIIRSIGIWKYIGTIIFELLVCGIILLSWFIILTIFGILVVNLPFSDILVSSVSIFLSAIVYAYLLTFSVKVNGLLYNSRKDA